MHKYLASQTVEVIYLR